VKLAIVGLVVLLLLGGGGALLYFQGDALFSKSDDPEEKTESVSAFRREPVHFEIKALAVPIIRNRRVERYVLLQITLDSYVMPGPKGVDLPVIRKRLIRESERTLGKGLVRKITVKGAVQRRSDRK
jgi:hypothetical protein